MKPLYTALFLALCLNTHAMAQSAGAYRADDWGIVSLDGPEGEPISLRLAGVEFPRPGSPGHALAMQFLDRLLSEAPSVMVTGSGSRTDRYGHFVGDIDLGGQSLAARLVSDGYAMAYSWQNTRQEGASLLAMESQARENGRGLWADGVFVVRSPDPNLLALYLETVQIVEGRVVAVAEARERTYLNFGFDYRTDFTVSIAASDVSLFTEAGIDLAELEGRNVRVRGWLGAINGPSMTIDHPERLEVLTPFEAD
ncbi:thermonuclease family protein [Hyphobacterium sp. HN65]|uniref:Thermonuclease family protein n=1 Tax=Hyphobacterium lacteum TaxID=3116575 RepID=A0ABU7LQ49_9PROT|nr:thermonuclease family protein [Hyphobacterium sp. HN65]MEE2526039.1 thermonuclease family protein [Hyphobacterium sp. HN65]